MNFLDYRRLQDDIAWALLSHNDLTDVNIITRGRLLLSENRLPDKTLAAEVLVYTSPRVPGGRKGCGVIVEPPTFTNDTPTSAGQIGTLLVDCLILEDRMINEALVTGTRKRADFVAQAIHDALHLLQIDGVGQLRSARNAITPAPDWEPLEAFHARLEILTARNQTQRSGYVTITVEDDLCTLTCATDGAEIRYTVDGSYPSPLNPASLTYSSPFEVSAGMEIRAASYLNEYNLSAVRRLEN